MISNVNFKTLSSLMKSSCFCVRTLYIYIYIYIYIYNAQYNNKEKNYQRNVNPDSPTVVSMTHVGIRNRSDMLLRIPCDHDNR